MKVKELINKLKKFDDNLEIIFSIIGYYPDGEPVKTECWLKNISLMDYENEKYIDIEIEEF